MRKVPKPQKVPGKRGRPKKHTDSVRPSNTDSSRGNGQTMAFDSQTASKASKKVITKERAQGSSASGIYYQVPNTRESSTSASTTHLATQESHHH
ncbi:hypothetical protein OROMI_030952 [Orobanche minor]